MPLLRICCLKLPREQGGRLMLLLCWQPLCLSPNQGSIVMPLLCMCCLFRPRQQGSRLLLLLCWQPLRLPCLQGSSLLLVQG